MGTFGIQASFLNPVIPELTAREARIVFAGGLLLSAYNASKAAT